jgi:hypothetical protein
MSEPTVHRTLVDVARAYTHGELAAWEVEAFEDRLAVDQEARDALVIAVQAQAGADAGSLRPDPSYRQEVIRRLVPGTWWAWLGRLGAGARPAWLGALAALVLVLVGGAWLLPGTKTPSEPVPVAQRPEKAPEVEHPEALVRFWADLPRGDHLARAVEEETASKLLRRDGVRSGRPDATVFLQPDGPMMP